LTKASYRGGSSLKESPAGEKGGSPSIEETGLQKREPRLKKKGVKERTREEMKGDREAKLAGNCGAIAFSKAKLHRTPKEKGKTFGER